jgi:hypothetical protein
VGLSFPLATPGQEKDNTVPVAYLKYIVYDKQYQPLKDTLIGITSKAAAINGGWEALGFDMTAAQDGYVQVLVANESSTDVWFDDLEITYTPGLIVQEQHYDPWGLTLAGIEKEGDYPYQFNSGSEKQKNASGQGYFYQTDFRDYDPQLGKLPCQINKAAADALKYIMRNGTRSPGFAKMHKGGVPCIEYRLPSGSGARFELNGEFIGFISPGF